MSPNDTIELLSLLERVGLFESNQLIELKEMLTDYFSGVSDNEKFWILDNDDMMMTTASLVLAFKSLKGLRDIYVHASYLTINTVLG